MFRLVAKSEMSSDCTIEYKVEFDEEYTLTDFIWAVFEYRPDEWGVFTIHCLGKQNKPIQETQEYKYAKTDNKTLNGLLGRYGHRKIKIAYACGGWSKMDYSIILE